MTDYRKIQLGQGNKSKGQLIGIYGRWIRIKCLIAADSEEKQDKICSNCYWHNHPLRIWGYNLSCKMA